MVSEHSAYNYLFSAKWDILTRIVVDDIITKTSNYSTFHLRLDGMVKGGLESSQSSDTLFV